MYHMITSLDVEETSKNKKKILWILDVKVTRYGKLLIKKLNSLELNDQPFGIFCIALDIFSSLQI